MNDYFNKINKSRNENPFCENPMTGHCGDVYKKMLLNDFVGDVTGLQNHRDVLEVGRRVIYNLDVHSLFVFHAAEAETWRNNFEQYGLKFNEWPFSELIPGCLSEERLPNHLRDATFNSPWAENQGCYIL